MYGSALGRTVYGAGDYNRALAMTGGYYAAGGFFDFIKKGVKAIGSVVSNPLVGAGLSLLPGGGIISRVAGAAGRFLQSPVGQVIKTGAKLAGVGLATGVGAAAAGRLINPAASGQPIKALPAFGGGGPGYVKTSVRGGGGGGRRRRRRAPRRRSRGRRRFSARVSYARGDYDQGDYPAGDRRSRSGRFTRRRGGQHRHRRGRRVTFMARGRRVSFYRKGDDE